MSSLPIFGGRLACSCGEAHTKSGSCAPRPHVGAPAADSRAIIWEMEKSWGWDNARSLRDAPRELTEMVAKIPLKGGLVVIFAYAKCPDCKELCRNVLDVPLDAPLAVVHDTDIREIQRAARAAVGKGRVDGAELLGALEQFPCTAVFRRGSLGMLSVRTFCRAEGWKEKVDRLLRSAVIVVGPCDHELMHRVRRELPGLDIPVEVIDSENPQEDLVQVCMSAGVSVEEAERCAGFPATVVLSAGTSPYLFSGLSGGWADRVRERL